MGPLRKLLLVGVGVVALYGVQACASDTELNPQPLPPQGGGEARSPESVSDDEKNDGTGAAAGGSSGDPQTPAPHADAGGDDASDGGTD